MRLAVFQFGANVGELESTADRGIVFRYTPEYTKGPQNRPISQSLPVREREYSQAAALPFFAGLLPDGELRRRIAEALHISETSSLKLLEALGGECAGTISLTPVQGVENSIAAQNNDGYDELALTELERMILESERIPLLVPRGGARLSLAGAQEKIPLLYKDRRWYKPMGNAPTSHILKPASPRFPEIVHNEYVVMRLAAAMGLPVSEVEFADFGKPVLMVKRYDRLYGTGGSLQRLHQEDFCQALTIMPERKYQNDGGPGFTDMAMLIRKACTAPLADLERLIDISLFNALVGNCDAHGKNFSLLYHDGLIELAPFYDLLATTYWPELDTKLSMKFGHTYRLSDLREDDCTGLARDLGVAPKMVSRRLDRLREVAPAAWDRLLDLPGLHSQNILVESIRAGWESRICQLMAG